MYIDICYNIHTYNTCIHSIYIYIYIHTHIYIYIHIYIYRERERERVNRRQVGDADSNLLAPDKRADAAVPSVFTTRVRRVQSYDRPGNESATSPAMLAKPAPKAWYAPHARRAGMFL